jgi:hypothetical protein
MGTFNLGIERDVTPDDSNAVVGGFTAIYATGSGSITWLTSGGDTHTIAACAVGRPIMAGYGTHIMATGTTATGITVV